MTTKWDTSELDQLVADLSEAPGRIQRSAPKVFQVAANKIKRGMAADASGHRYLGGLPAHVSYDHIAFLRYEIGFDKVGQGNLANFAAFGSINNAPVMDHRAALRRELPSLVRHLGDEGQSAILGDRR